MARPVTLNNDADADRFLRSRHSLWPTIAAYLDSRLDRDAFRRACGLDADGDVFLLEAAVGRKLAEAVDQARYQRAGVA